MKNLLRAALASLLCVLCNTSIADTMECRYSMPGNIKVQVSWDLKTGVATKKATGQQVYSGVVTIRENRNVWAGVSLSFPNLFTAPTPGGWTETFEQEVVIFGNAEDRNFSGGATRVIDAGFTRTQGIRFLTNTFETSTVSCLTVYR